MLLDVPLPLQIENKATGEIVTRSYDAVMACTGHHGQPYRPDFNGLSQFKGVSPRSVLVLVLASFRT